MNEFDAIMAEFESTMAEFEDAFAAYEAEMQEYHTLIDDTAGDEYDQVMSAYRNGRTGAQVGAD